MTVLVLYSLIFILVKLMLFGSFNMNDAEIRKNKKKIK